jgi:ubiquinone/menaquinone biosynthesis C-methylase UbiE
VTYDAAAAAYDATYSDRLSRAEDLATRRIIEPFINDRDVLDAGCGTGLTLTMGHPRSYHGIDASPAMIDQARKRWQHSPVRPTFTVCPAEDYTAAPASYDTITCLWAWPHFTTPVEILQSWYSALRFGGSVVLLSWDHRHTPTVQTDDPVTAAPAAIIGAVAARIGYRVAPLGGLMRRETARKVARALPLTLAASVIERGAQSPAFILALRKPGAIGPTPLRARRVQPLIQRRSFRPGVQ